LRGLEAKYAVHIRLIGNPVVDFLLVIIKLCYGAKRKYRLKFGVFEGGRGEQKFQAEGDATNHFASLYML